MNNLLEFGITDILVGLLYLLVLNHGVTYFRLKFGRKYSLLYMMMGMIHILTTIFYLVYIIYNPGDTKAYYLASLSYDFTLKQGSEFIVFLASILTRLFHLRLIGAMLVFSFIGLIGWKLLLEVIGNVLLKSWTNWLYVFLLPQMHFWTCALGKDSLCFFSISSILYLWYYKRHLFNYLLPGSILLFTRSHIFLVVIFSLLTSTLLQKKINWTSRAIIISVGIVAIIAAMPLVQERLYLKSFESDALVSYSRELLSRNQGGGMSIDMSNSHIVVRLVSYIFRPFFFDASNALQLEASLENLVWAFMVLSFIRKFKVKYIMIFPLVAFLFLWILQSSVLTNLAIAMRQKMLFFPFLFSNLIVLVHRDEIVKSSQFLTKLK